MPDVLITVALTAVLLRLSWIDLHSFRLPDTWTLPLIASGLLLAATGGGVPVLASLIGGAWPLGPSGRLGHFITIEPGKRVWGLVMPSFLQLVEPGWDTVRCLMSC